MATDVRELGKNKRVPSFIQSTTRQSVIKHTHERERERDSFLVVRHNEDEQQKRPWLRATLEVCHRVIRLEMPARKDAADISLVCLCIFVGPF